ncbi:hypothetical protein GCM10010967_27040 [Dyadobacter beijingensis]|uniref:Uncharacterized protein n=1 Tax=Dyadobacter beijingensis TaxID=365489 RepID=A0ABQ2HXK8_9BACT|nr:hypothetical protein [Dyadobacter beijingensis]GGM92430.1 hypothetical protein GCM10010967_27040 [Dyadobacter beijingensis]
MAKERKFDFAPLPLPEVQEEPAVEITPAPAEVVDGAPTKVTFDCDFVLMENMKDYGYWEGLTQKDIIIESLKLYFQDKEIRPRPDKIRNRTKVGRKPKSALI